MKAICLMILLITFIACSLCYASDAVLQKAYALFYRGEKEAAIDLIEDYVRDHPEANAFYFLGYAYYEIDNLEKSRKYFNEAYQHESFYSPMPSEGDQ